MDNIRYIISSEVEQKFCFHLISVVKHKTSMLNIILSENILLDIVWEFYFRIISVVKRKTSCYVFEKKTCINFLENSRLLQCYT